MSKLQNNFTNIEQSKRLLELGVPADSADCYYTESGKIEIKNTSLDILYTPCWSVGRLMEIFDICCAIISDYNDWCKTQCVPDEYVVYIIGCYERATDNKLLDFSKLGNEYGMGSSR